MVRVRYSFGSRHTRNLENIKKQRAKYPDVAKDVIRISDIILEIIDARYINETRNTEIENELKEKGKKVIYILNKEDLINQDKIPKKLYKGLNPHVFVSTKTSKGAKELRDRIKIEGKRLDIGDKKRVHLGIIGYPNTGKSSIINLITRKGITSTSKQAGHTKGMQKIKMSDRVLILDTPGVIPESKYSTDERLKLSQDTKIGARTYSHIKDPEDVVHYLMKDNNAKKIENFYNIDAKGDSEALIKELGIKKNFLKKKGQIDIDRTARLILRDWQEGRISSKWNIKQQ